MPAQKDEAIGTRTGQKDKAGNNDKALSGLELSFFDFEPHHPTSNPASGSRWSQPTLNPIWFPVSNQPISPPNSALAAAPNSWPTDDLYHQPPLRIQTNVNATKDPSPPNQLTPPDGETPTGDAMSQLSQPISRSKQSKKTSKSSATSKPTPPSKRHRRSAARNCEDTEDLDPNHPDEIRRSKFLERNRVAASKCRQKKKHWIENLEVKARELHADNNTMRLVIDSYRNEIEHLRGELAKHGHCGCSTVQDWMEDDTALMLAPLEAIAPDNTLSPSQSDSPASLTLQSPYSSPSYKCLVDEELSPAAARPPDDLIEKALRSGF